jgi:D-alanyl-D-alanine carboxypeptidase (penicillin-binding protein 5/6)
MTRLRTIAALTAGVLVLGAAGYTTAAALAPLDPIAPTGEPLPALTTPPAVVDLPGYGAWAVGAADDRQLYAGQRIDERLPMASIAKVVTALVVLAEHPIAEGTTGAAITLTAADSRLPARYAAINGTVAPAPAGLIVSQRAIIELMMVHSANNYAETLAVWAFGSEDAYRQAARRWLDTHGMPGVTIADATGFSPQNAGTARELVALARLAAADPVVSAAAALPEVTVPGVGRYENRNLALGRAGVDGLKTGTLRAIGSNLLFSAELSVDGETVPVVGAAIGGPDQATIARDLDALLASLVDDFHPLVLAEAGTVVARYQAPWGDRLELRVVESAETRVWGHVRAVPLVEAPLIQPGVPLPRAPRLTVRTPAGDVPVRLEWVGAIEAPPLGWRLQAPLDALAAGG